MKPDDIARKVRESQLGQAAGQEPVLIPFDDIQRAKLLLTDALIAAAGNGPGARRH